MRKKIKKILCPTDFSDVSNNAVEYAASFAKKYNASLTLWNMYDLPVLDFALSKAGLPYRKGSHYKENQQILKDWCEVVRQDFGVPCGFSLEKNENNLQKTLAFYFDGENFDMIISGTNGADNVFQYFFGSNSYNILKNTKSPLLVVPDNCTYEDIYSILFLSDYQADDDISIRQLHDVFKSKIDVLHLSEHDTNASKDVFHAKVSEYNDKLDVSIAIDYHRQVGKNKMDGLYAYLESNDPDIIVMTTQNRSTAESLLHTSFTKKMLERLGFPMLILDNNQL